MTLDQIFSKTNALTTYQARLAERTRPPHATKVAQPEIEKLKLLPIFIAINYKVVAPINVHTAESLNCEL